MGKKYIVEIGRLERLYKASISAKGMPNMTWLSPEVDLTPYTEPDFEQVRKEAYEDGYKTAKIQCGIQAEKDMREVGKRHYQRGLSDAWKAVRKIIHMPEGDLLNIFTECYSAVCTALQVLLKYDAAEAIEKLKAYEEKQKVADKIEVGDEVTAFNELTEEVEHFVVIEVGGYFGKGNVGLFALYGNNKSSVDFKAGCFSISAKDVTKTGRHFDIDKILEEMRT